MDDAKHTLLYVVLGIAGAVPPYVLVPEGGTRQVVVSLGLAAMILGPLGAIVGRRVLAREGID